MKLEKAEALYYWGLTARVRGSLVESVASYLIASASVEGRPHGLGSVYNVMDYLRLDMWQNHPDFSDTSEEEIDRCRMPRFVSFLRRLTQLSKDSASSL